MKSLKLIIFILVLGLVGSIIVLSQKKGVKMQIFSSAFENGETIPSKYSCDGDNVGPPLTFANVPETTKSLALIVDDPDAPSGTWIHWLIWNIDPKTTTLAENSVPAGAVQGTASSGQAKYGGPCPPSGEHRYFFKLYALDSRLNLISSARIEELEAAIKGHVLTQAQIMGRYGRE
ncbi:MAG: YbhB/YbcL family Raf kinase inhibitor-like protein [Candidatus Beckwithbacteria bacterium]|nr:YbhB/YbcL family Raf kinase inhibitor-like protein [Candidatus Beckwithbacteria bacterium]